MVKSVNLIKIMKESDEHYIKMFKNLSTIGWRHGIPLGKIGNWKYEVSYSDSSDKGVNLNLRLSRNKESYVVSLISNDSKYVIYEPESRGNVPDEIVEEIRSNISELDNSVHNILKDIYEMDVDETKSHLRAVTSYQYFPKTLGLIKEVNPIFIKYIMSPQIIDWRKKVDRKKYTCTDVELTNTYSGLCIDITIKDIIFGEIGYSLRLDAVTGPKYESAFKEFIPQLNELDKLLYRKLKSYVRDLTKDVEDLGGHYRWS